MDLRRLRTPSGEDSLHGVLHEVICGIGVSEQQHEAADVGLDLCDERAEGPAVAALRRSYER